MLDEWPLIKKVIPSDDIVFEPVFLGNKKIALVSEYDDEQPPKDANTLHMTETEVNLLKHNEVRNPVAIIFGALATLQREQRSEEEASCSGSSGRKRRGSSSSSLASRRRPPFRAPVLAKGCVAGRPLRDRPGDGWHRRPSDGGRARERTFGRGRVRRGAPRAGISNLVQNALVARVAAHPYACRRASSKTRPKMLRIRVCDDGNGVSSEARPRLFTPFFTTRATGTGLGLALVKRIRRRRTAAPSTTSPPPLAARPSSCACHSARAEVTPRRLLGADVQ